MHEWRNDCPTVPTSDRVNSLLGEYAEDFQRETKTPWSFTIVCRWNTVTVAQRKQERRNAHCGGHECEIETLLFGCCVSNPKRNIGRWIVWLGRYALEKETRAPNVRLIPVRNRE